MATYLQGVTDFIPQFQPFQPDLNFYGNVLQTKQTQYDNNWKALNNMYSKYYYAELTRDKNVASRDAFIKDAQFNLKRISQLDLSLEQNVRQATQVFRPFYENKDLMKDMAWTKNRNTELAGADSFRNSLDPEMNKKYWEPGVQEIMYKTEEFKNATDEEAMSFANVKYTPNVDILGRANEIAKDFGDVQSVTISGDNRWVIKTKNGEQLEEPLEKLFQARLGSDPSVQAYFKTQAYVERKNYAEYNAAQFNGDKNAAEMSYLQDKFNVMKIKNQAAYKQMQEQSVVYDNKIADIKGQIDAGNKDPKLKKALDQYLMNKEINDQVLERVKKENDLFNSNQGADQNNPYGDIKSFRYKVDSGVAADLMSKKLGEAAHVYAFRNYFQDMDANPYQVNNEKYAQNLSLMNKKYQNEAALAEYKAGLKQKLDDRKYKLDAGTHYLNEKGELVEKFDQAHFFTEVLDAGTATSKTNLRAENEVVQQRYTQNYAVPYFNTMMRVLTEGSTAGAKLTQKQINYIINGNEDKYADLNKWAKQIQSNPNTFLADKVGINWMKAINTRFKTFVSENSELSSIKNVQDQLATTSTKFDDYLLFLGESKKFERDLATGVEKELARQGIKGANLLYDEKGNKRNEKQFFEALMKSGQLSKEEMDNINRIKRETANRTGKNIVLDAVTRGMTGWSVTDKILGTVAKTVANADRIGPGNWLDQIIESKLYGNYYKEAITAASQIVSDPTVVSKITGRKTIPGLEKISDGSGMFGKAQFTVINPKSSWGTYHYGQVLNNIRSQDLGDAKNVTLSIGGISQSGAENKLSDDTTRAILAELQRSMDAAPKGFNFRLGVAPIAMNNAGKSAYIFQLPPELIKKLTGKENDEGDVEGGLLSPSQATQLMENGLSVIMNRKAFNSDMYNSMFVDPLAAYVDRDNTYNWSDPTDSRYKIDISQSSIGGDGSYQMDYSLPVFDTETNTWQIGSYTTIADNAKQNLSDLRDNIIQGFNGAKQVNNQRVNGY
jgi:hypothetical protein